MAEFKQAVITEKGLHLNTKIQSGKCYATFTRAAIGNGIWEPGEGESIEDLLFEATNLKSQMMEATFSEVTVAGKDKVLLSSAFPNSSVEHRFKITELGIFAQDPDLGEILYSISVCDEAAADLMPSQYGGSVTMVYKNYITIWNAARVTIMTSGAFALATDLEEVQARFNTMKATTEDEIRAIIDGTYEYPGDDGWEIPGYMPPNVIDPRSIIDETTESEIREIVNGTYEYEEGDWYVPTDPDREGEDSRDAEDSEIQRVIDGLYDE
jgi:hypothetical protein